MSDNTKINNTQHDSDITNTYQCFLFVALMKKHSLVSTRWHHLFVCLLACLFVWLFKLQQIIDGAHESSHNPYNIRSYFGSTSVAVFNMCVCVRVCVCPTFKLQTPDGISCNVRHCASLQSA